MSVEKNTRQKKCILASVAALGTHPTADEVYAYAREDNEHLSLGTVYRNLNRFAEEQKIRRISVPNESDRFDARMDRHEHMLCSKCGRVLDIEMDVDIEGFTNVVPMHEKKHTVTGYSLMLYGVCGDCKE